MANPNANFSLSVDTEDDEDSHVKFTKSGAFVVGDFFRINNQGFQFKGEEEEEAAAAQASGRASKRPRSSSAPRSNRRLDASSMLTITTTPPSESPLDIPTTPLFDDAADRDTNQGTTAAAAAAAAASSSSSSSSSAAPSSRSNLSVKTKNPGPLRHKLTLTPLLSTEDSGDEVSTIPVTEYDPNAPQHMNLSSPLGATPSPSWASSGPSAPSSVTSLSSFQSGATVPGVPMTPTDVVMNSASGDLPVVVNSLDELKSLETAGQGASGVVQRVLHMPSNTTLALKVVPVDLGSEKKSERVVTELKTLHASKHPHIVSFFGAFYTDGAISLVLEYMNAGSLLDLLRTTKRVPEPILARIAEQVLKGLAYLHESRRVIHRDIKPSNILLHRNGRAKIADFGVSGEVTGTMDMKVSFVGTVTYMSPERIKGEEHSYDSDLWSLGLALVECALGYFPYLNSDQRSVTTRTSLGFWDIMSKIVEQEPPALPVRRPNPDGSSSSSSASASASAPSAPSASSSDEDELLFSPEFGAFVSQCMSKVPSGRGTASQLLNHPFIKMYDDDSVDLAAWVQQVHDETIRRRQEARQSAAALMFHDASPRSKPTRKRSHPL